MRYAAMLWGNVKAGSGGGNDGITPHIGPNGNWFIGSTDTGVRAQGTDGLNTYLYVAYASDDEGSDFSPVPNDNLKYRAEIQTHSEIENPDSTDFAEAIWVKYVGDDGQGGGSPGGSENPELHIDFEEAGDEFVYNVPYAMKFTSMVCEGADATLDVALNTTMARYDRLTITATAAGLVSLYGEYVES